MNDNRQVRWWVIRLVMRIVGTAVVVVAVLVKLIQPGPLILRDLLFPQNPSPVTLIVLVIGWFLVGDFLTYLGKRLGKRLGPRRANQAWWTVIVVVALVVLIIGIGYDLQWTGFGQSKVAQDVRPEKTLWDWMDLLIVPIVLGIGGYLFTRSETRATQAAAERRAQDDTLQAYLDQMSAMLIPNKDQPSLSDEHPPDSLKTVARARTLTVLSRLNPDHKARVVQFLYESGLIAKGRPVLDLHGANLIGTNLKTALSEVNLSEANLSEANLSEAHLSEAHLMQVRMSTALSRPNLSGANLSGANLSGANLSWTDLSGANLSVAHLIGADLHQANLIGADLSEAHLIGADLQGADLMQADLTSTRLREADLKGADLRGAKGWTKEQFADAHIAANSYPSTTMPDGQDIGGILQDTLEDWLKDREGRGEAGEKSGP